MCGVLGIISSSPIDNDKLNNSLNNLIDRGPDNQDIVLGKIMKNKFYSLGQTRLSIIDLSKKANQPFKKNNLEITYNGEIFNYLEIKKELISLGYKFKTNSDTEVIISSYHQWGLKCFNKFNGFWSLIIIDKLVNINEKS